MKIAKTMKRGKPTFTIPELDRLVADGKIRGYKDDFKEKEVSKKLPKIKRKEAPQLMEMKMFLRCENIPFEAEYKFSDKRKFRFDIAFPEKKIAVEYEGIFAGKSRHTNVMGYSKDTEKYNLAGSLGWTVLRYTAMNYKQFYSQIK